MSIDYEYVTIDVDIIVHAKGYAAGVEAMGLWLWGMAWSHKTGANGKLPRHVVVATWGASAAVVIKLAKRLVTAGLWVATDDGWTIWNYGKKNQSAEEKERRRELGRERMRRLREKRDGVGDAKCDASHTRHVHDESAAPDLICDASSRSREPDPARATPEDRPSRPHNDAPPCATPTSLVDIADPMAPPPEWWEAVCKTVSVGCLNREDGLNSAEMWLAYGGHRGEKRRRPSRNDACTWLTTVMVPKAKDAIRRAAAERDREATFAARFPPKSDVAPMTPYRVVADAPTDDPTAEELAEVRRLAAKGLEFLDTSKTGTDE